MFSQLRFSDESFFQERTSAFGDRYPLPNRTVAKLYTASRQEYR